MPDQPKPLSQCLAMLATSIVLYFISRSNYLLFHAIVESFAIIVAALIYVLATRTYQYSLNSTFLFLGIAYFYIAILDFFHMLTYKGMGVFPGFGSNLPTQLWIAGRFMEAFSFLILLFIQHKRINRKLLTAAYASVTACLLLSTMVFGIFPVCFVEGEGLTTFKVFSEYIIILILLSTAYTMHLRRDQVEKDVFKTITTAMLITAASELSFTLYSDVYGVANMVGHLLKVVSYYFVCSGVVKLGIDTPYSLISDELKERAIKDVLTGLHNRQGLLELLNNEIDHVRQGKNSLGILMMDLDNFKLINDSFGHLYGDEVLKEFAALLDSSIRENDIACRLGGDEFVVLARNVDLDRLNYVKKRIGVAAGAWIAGNAKLWGLGVSIGTSLLLPRQTLDIDQLLKIADKSMYAAKKNKNKLIPAIENKNLNCIGPFKHRSTT